MNGSSVNETRYGQIMLQKRGFVDQVESGKQLGTHFTFAEMGRTYRGAVAIQKHQGRYKVHIYEIDDAHMAMEHFRREETTPFVTLAEAIHYIDHTTRVTISALKPCKGQKIFNPDFG